MSTNSDEKDGELYPAESTPAEIPESCFEKGTRFERVAVGDNCSFALTDTGSVYGWGRFTVRHTPQSPLYNGILTIS